MTLPEQLKVERPLDVGEVAEFLRIGRGTALALLQKGEIRARKCGGQWRVTLDALREYLAACDNAPKSTPKGARMPKEVAKS